MMSKLTAIYIVVSTGELITNIEYLVDFADLVLKAVGQCARPIHTSARKIA
jgi:hypothetical protein